jgi:folate-binding protein YgfZ
MPLTLLLHGRHEGPAVVYEPFGPWLVPWRYGAFEAEYAALAQGPALSDLSVYGLLEVQGRDRLAFLHNLLSQHIKRLVPGQGARTALLDPSARVLGELLVLALPEACWLLCPLDQLAEIGAALERYVFAEDVQLINRERPFAALGLHGPALSAWCTRSLQTTPCPETPYAHQEAIVDGIPVRWVRFSPFGLEGLLCLVEASRTSALWQALRARPRVQPVGWHALNTARLEQGVPWYGLDFDATNLLPETGLEAALASDEKGCYVGQEIVARMQTYGSANKKLVGLWIEGAGDVPPGTALSLEGVVVGRVTSACHSPKLQRWIGLGSVKRGAYDVGTIVTLPDERRATISARPLVS